MAVTLKDIALEAGVTTATVSRALRGSGSISDEVRQRVFEIADRRGYRRKTSIQTVSYVIDKHFFNVTSHFYNGVILGIEQGLKDHGYSFQFVSLEPERFSVQNAMIANLAGMIVTSSYHDDFILQVKQMGIPLVLLDYALPDEYIDSVLIDNVDGMQTGTRYLVSLGHRRIVYLSGETGMVSIANRLRGYRLAMESAGLAIDESLILPCDFSIQSAYETMSRFLSSPPAAGATAVVAVNDIVAIGAIEAIKAHKLRIPQDVSVLGFDNIDLGAEVIPPLSTMDVRKRMLGWHAAERLIQVINGAEAGQTKILVRPTLCVRDSTGPCPTA